MAAQRELIQEMLGINTLHNLLLDGGSQRPFNNDTSIINNYNNCFKEYLVDASGSYIK